MAPPPTKYTDIYVRDGNDDQGYVPYSGTFNYAAPDIIPLQQTTPALSWFVDTWGQNPGLDITAGINNYVYVRGMNLGAAPASGTVFLYAVPSTLLLDISRWATTPLPTGSGTTAVLVDTASGSPSIPAGNICAVNTPFLLSEAVPQGFHYCLVTRLVTDAHPNPLPAPFQSLGDFVDWVAENPNVAMRNITTLPSTTGAVSQSQSFANLDQTAEIYWFLVEGVGYPANSTVSIQGLTTGCQFSFQGVFGPPGGVQTAVTTQSVPAASSESPFVGIVNVTVTPPSGLPIPPGATLKICYFRQLTARDSPGLVKHGVRADRRGFEPKALKRALGSQDVPSIVDVGCCNIWIADTVNTR